MLHAGFFRDAGPGGNICKNGIFIHLGEGDHYGHAEGDKDQSQRPSDGALGQKWIGAEGDDAQNKSGHEE